MYLEFCCNSYASWMLTSCHFNDQSHNCNQYRWKLPDEFGTRLRQNLSSWTVLVAWNRSFNHCLHYRLYCSYFSAVFISYYAWSWNKTFSPSYHSSCIHRAYEICLYPEQSNWHRWYWLLNTDFHCSFLRAVHNWLQYGVYLSLYRKKLAKRVVGSDTKENVLDIGKCLNWNKSNRTLISSMVKVKENCGYNSVTKLWKNFYKNGFKVTICDFDKF